MNFSERKGIKNVKSIMQMDSMDDDLRNALWNSTVIYYWDNAASSPPGYSYKNLLSNRNLVFLIMGIWDGHFRKPIDTIPEYWKDTISKLREYYFKSKWNEAYDFIEHIANNNFYDGPHNQSFINYCNEVLKRDLSAYRFVGGFISPITSEEEISEVQEALDYSKSLKSVHSHLLRAIDLLSDRKTPDYRNSIKESISSIEALCIIINGDEKGTLAQALKKIELKIEIHSALKTAFDKLYGYTSDAEGIRHALIEESSLDFEDAKFMMVTCSAFINYLIAKSSKAGVNIHK